LCITSGFPLAACDAQSLVMLGEFAITSGLEKSAKGIRKRLKGSRLCAQVAKEYM
jgi:hypothetical protein